MTTLRDWVKFRNAPGSWGRAKTGNDRPSLVRRRSTTDASVPSR